MSTKGIVVFRAKPGVSRDSVRAWLVGRSAVNARAPRPRGYAVNLITQEVHGAQGLDGLVEVWSDSTEGLEKANWLSQPFGPLESDGAESPVVPVAAFEVEEHVILPPFAATSAVIKRVTFLQRKPGVTEEAFRAWYLGHHTGVAKAMPGLGGYVTNMVRREAIGNLGLQAVAMFWFADKERYDTFYEPSRPLMGQMIQSTAPMVTRVTSFLVEERTVIPPHR